MHMEFNNNERYEVGPRQKNNDSQNTYVVLVFYFKYLCILRVNVQSYMIYLCFKSNIMMILK